MTEDEQQDLEHLRALLESQAKQIENLRRLLKESGDRVDRHIRRNFELRAELARTSPIRYRWHRSIRDWLRLMLGGVVMGRLWRLGRNVICRLS